MARLTDIRLRRSAVSGNQPGVNDLNLGELALNTADGKLYMKKSVGGTDSIVEIGADTGSIASTFTAFEYTATSSQTTFSGSDNYSNTLAYNTGTPPKVQVFMNGILLDEGSSADYTATNGTSVVLTSAATTGDLVQIHAYKSDVSVNNDLSFGDNIKLEFGDAQDLQIYHDGSNSYINDTGTGALFLKTNYLAVAGANGNQLINAEQGGAVELYHNNSKKLETISTGVNIQGTIANASGHMILDSTNDILLDADGGNINLRDNGVSFGNFNHNGNNLAIDAKIQDGDLVFRGNDGGSVITALTLDMSSAGEAVFNSDIRLFDSKAVRFGTDQDFRISNDGNHTTLQNSTADQDILIKGNDGGSTITALTLDMSNAGKATFNGIVSSAQGFERGNLFITQNEIDVSSGDITLDVAGDIILDAGGQNWFFDDDGTRVLSISQVSSDVYIGTEQTDKDLIFRGKDGASTITALTLDMSEAGKATFNAGVTTGGSIIAGANIFRGNMQIESNEIDVSSGDLLVDVAGDIILDSDGGLIEFKNGGTRFGRFTHANSNLELQSMENSGDILFRGKDSGGNNVTALTLDMSDAGAATFNSHVTIGGNLTVNGTTTTINSTTLTVDDKNIVLASGAADAAAANGAGITIDGASANITYTSTTDEFDFNKSLHISGAGGSGVKINSGGAIVGGGASGGDTQLMYWGGGPVYYGRSGLGGTVSGHEFRVGGVTKLNVNSSGNTIAAGQVGIGESSPTSPLHVTHTGGTGVRLKTDGDNDSNLIHFKTSANTGQGYIGTEGGTSGTNFVGSSAYAFMVGGTASGSKLQFLSAGVVRGTFDTSGNLNIGVSSAYSGAKLSVAGSTVLANGNQFVIGTFGTSGLQLIGTAGGDNVVGTMGSSEPLLFRTASTERMQISAAGQVGIGVAPAAGIQLQLGNAANNSAITRVTNGTVHVDLTASSSGKAFLEVGTSHPLVFATNATERVRIDAAGSIGFNTSNPLRPFDSRNSIQIFGSGGYTELMLRGRAGTAQNLGAFHFSIRSDVGGDNDDLMLLRFTGGNSPSYAGTSMHIRNDNGHVGIGTNTGQPSSLLHVVGGSATIPTLSSSYPLTISNNGNSGLNIISSGTTNAGQINFGDSGDADAGRIRYDHNDNSMRFTTNATERMRIDSAGTVGIGTTDLHTWAAFDGRLRLGAKGVYATTPASTQVGYNWYYDNSSNYRYIAADVANRYYQNGGNHVWETAASGSADGVITWAEKMSISSSGAIKFNNAFTFPTADGSSGQVLQTDGSGNVAWATVSGGGGSTVWSTSGSNIYYNSGSVGIGTSSPAALLHLKSTANSSGPSLIFENTNNAQTMNIDYYSNAGSVQSRISYEEGPGAFNFIPNVSNANSAMYINYAGNVGIGTTAPTHKLHVKNDNDYAVKFGGTGGGDYSIEIGQGTTNSSAGFNATGTNGSMLFKISDSEKMRIKYDGNVGIGTNSPDQPLHVVGADSGIKISSDASDRPHLSLFNGTSEMLRLSANNLYGAIGDSTNSQRYMTFKAGNIGIGTTAPANKLHVTSGTVNTAIARFTGANNDRGLVISTAVSGSTNDSIINYDAVSTNSVGQHAFKTDGTERVRIDASGNVGIGTNSPNTHTNQTTLTINGTTHGRVDFETAGTLRASVYGDSGSLNIDALGNFARFHAGNSERMRILANGNIGIGTTAPDQPLHVVGTRPLRLERSGVGEFEISIDNTVSGDSSDFVIEPVSGTNSAGFQVRTRNTGGSLIEAVNVNHDGQVGIGTDSPSSFVESSRFVVGSGASGTNEMMFLYSGTNTFGALGFADGTSGTEAYRGIMGYDHNTDTMFFSTAGGGNASRDMIIGSTGGVSIGTSTAAGSGGLLVDNDIKGNSRIGVGSGGNLSDAAIYRNSDTNTGIIWPAADTLGFTTAGAERLRFNSGGSALFNSAGTALMASFDNTRSTGGYLRWMENGTASFFIGTSNTVGGGTGGFYDLYAVAGKGQRFFTGAAERMRIFSGGNTSIGSSTDLGYKLNVVGNALFRTDSAATTFGNHSSSIRIQNKNTTDNNYAGIVFDGSANAAGAIQFQYTDQSGSYGDICFETRGSGGYAERLRINNQGRVGIGTTAPAETLTVSGTGAVSGKFAVMSTAVHNNFDFYNNGTTYLNGSATVDDVLDITGSNAALKVAGTTVIDSNRRILAADGAANVPYITFASDTNTGLYRPGTDILGFSTAGSERMRIDANGSVFIASTSDSGSNRHFFQHDGFVRHKRANLVGVFDRDNTDGDILKIRKDGSDVGTFGSNSGQFLIDSNASNVVISANSGSSSVITRGVLRPLVDDTDDLGLSNRRFQDLHLSRSATIGSASIDNFAVNTSSTSVAQVDTFSATTIRSARFTVQITNTTDSTYQVTEILLIHDGTTPAITEYGTIFTGSAKEASFDADIVSGNVRLLATPASSDSMQFKTVRHSILV